MMEFINVNSLVPRTSDKVDYTPLEIRLTKNTLISLIGGLRQKEFGLDTLYDVMQKIRAFRKEYFTGNVEALYIDSGGYSIIKGDVKPAYTSKFIDCYHVYLEDDRKIFDYIFSLDVPFYLQHRWFNTKENIYEFNKRSLQKSIDVLGRYSNLQDKFYFIWHFKLIEQYEIWKQLYEELKLSEIIKQRAIGGMVGLRGIKKIDYSPFTAIAFRCLDDYIKAGKYDHDFRLHFLGINIDYDRFQIAFLEELFNRYLKGKSKSVLTYDSINYSRTAQMKVKNLEIYSYEKDVVKIYDNIKSVPDGIIKSVYGNGDVYEAIQKELHNLKGGKRLLNINAFAPLNMYSNINLDRYFQKLIKEERLVDIIFEEKNGAAYLEYVKEIMDKSAIIHPEIFTRKKVESIMKNMEITFLFHLWFIEGQDSEKLDRMVRRFIRMIDFPASLSDEDIKRMIVY